MTPWTRFLAWLHDIWCRTRGVIAVLAIIRFSLLIPAVLAITLVVADQMIDILRAVGEDGRSGGVIWLLVMTAFAGLVVWYAARTMLRFRFALNPASDPTVHPQLKKLLPRWLGISIPGLLTVRVAQLACGSTAIAVSRISLWIFTATLLLVTALVALYVFQRRRIAKATGLRALAVPENEERRNLARWRELPGTTRYVLIGLGLLDVVVILLFMWTPFYSAGIPVMLQAPAILLLGLGLTAVGGSSLVYLANHHGIPIISLLLVWTVICSVNNDNHMVRVDKDAKSHGFLVRAKTTAAGALKSSSPLGEMSVKSYFEQWFTELARDEPPSSEPIPVFVVAAEGGGLRAAYWTSIVLAALEDATAARPTPFSRHVFAISGVSGGSVGAVLFDAAVANRASPTGFRSDTRVEEMDLMLGKDFLSDTLGAGLFPDLLQRFVPAPFVNDRAIALERAFERAWDDEHLHDTGRLRGPFHDLWRANPRRVPLLFLNSTVVETGQRAINSPLATISSADETFGDSLSVGRLIGTELPLSTAALLSARFTYVSPAALIDTHRTRDPNCAQEPGCTQVPRWLRLVDGGYFDNSGVVTAQEIVRAMLEAHKCYMAAGGADDAHRKMKIIVLHLPNEPMRASAILNDTESQSSDVEFMSEVLAPIVTLLHTRSARGTQAVSYLQKQVSLVSIRPRTAPVTAPLGWVLSQQVRDEMRSQLGACADADGECAGAKLASLLKILAGDAPVGNSSDFDRPAVCEAAPN